MNSEKEIKRNIALMSAISFLLAFNYYIVRSLKDALLITSQGSGAEVIPFVRVWLLVPTSCLLALGFSFLVSFCSLRRTFSIVVTFFLGVFAGCVFVLFPTGSQLEPVVFSNWLKEYLPAGWQAFAEVVRYWRFALFYVFAESWAPIIYSVLFWGFANEILTYSLAKKYYPFLTLAGTVAALVAGPLAIYLSTFEGEGAWERSLCILISIVIVCGAVSILLFGYVCPTSQKVGRSQVGPKMGFIESIRSLAQSTHLLLIAAGGISYTVMVNLSELVWKDELVRAFPSPGDFNSAMNGVTIATGVISTLITLFVTRQSLSKFGWTTTAFITPVAVLLTSFLFFLPTIFSTWELLHVSPLFLVCLGACHICVCCSGKYTLFDTTKELALIPLQSGEKIHGKAAIDGVGSRVGKAGSSLVVHFLFIAFPSIAAATPVIGFLVLGMIFCMLFAVYRLGFYVERIQDTAV